MSQYEYVNILYFFKKTSKFFNVKFGDFTPHKLGL